MPGNDPKLKLIQGVPLFGGCGARDLEEIGRLSDEIDVAAGEVLIRQGTTAQEFFIVINGALRVERDGTLVARVGPGEFVGEIALVDGGPRNATVTTDVASRLLVVGHREFHSLLEQFPGVQLQVLQALAQRVRASAPDAIY